MQVQQWLPLDHKLAHRHTHGNHLPLGIGFLDQAVQVHLLHKPGERGRQRVACRFMA